MLLTLCLGFSLTVQLVFGQNLTVCENPELSKPCILICSNHMHGQSTMLYKGGRLKIECDQFGKCTSNADIKSVDWELGSVGFVIKKLRATDSGYWKCKSGNNFGIGKRLQVYSFNERNVEIKAKANDKTCTVIVKVKCVFPSPTMTAKYCGRKVCEVEGEVFYNGPCKNEKTETHNFMRCEFDLNEHTCREPDSLQVEIIISLGSKRIFFRNTTFRHPKCLSTIGMQGVDNHRDVFSVHTFLASVAFTATIVILFIIYKFMEYRKKRKKSQRRQHATEMEENENETEFNLPLNGNYRRDSNVAESGIYPSESSHGPTRDRNRGILKIFKKKQPKRKTAGMDPCC